MPCLYKHGDTRISVPVLVVPVDLLWCLGIGIMFCHLVSMIRDFQIRLSRTIDFLLCSGFGFCVSCGLAPEFSFVPSLLRDASYNVEIGQVKS